MAAILYRFLFFVDASVICSDEWGVEWGRGADDRQRGGPHH